jgi:tetratricopeptide (TPR) repeat protein
MSSSFLNKESLAPYPEPSSVPAEFREDFRECIRLSRHYLENADPASLQMNVELLGRIRTHPRFSHTPDDFRALILNESGGALNRRYFLFGNPQDLEVALGCWEEAVALARPGPLLLCCLNNLAAGLRAQYSLSGDREKLRRAIEALKKAIEHTEEYSPDLPTRLNNLGNALHTNWECGGDPADLQGALAALEKAVHLTHIRSPDLPVRLNNLARLFLGRYNLSGDLDDLNQAIETSEQAVRLSPVNSFDLPLCLSGLGIGLSYRYLHENNLEDLQKAIRIQEEAIRSCPDSAPEKLMYFDDLANALSARYDHTGNLEDLLRSVEEFEKVVHLTSAPSPELPSYLNNLTVALRRLYVRTGRLEILEKAVAVGKEAVQRSPSDSPGLPPRLSNLADGLIDRYGRTAELSDLEQAIQIYKEALRKTAVGHTSRPQILNSLALALRDLGRSTYDWERFDRAIETLKTALQEAPPQGSFRPMYLNNLGSLLAERFTVLGDPTDLEQAIAVGEESVGLSAADSPMGSMFRINLAEDLHIRYLATNDADLLRKAIDLCDEAVKHTPPDFPFFPRYLSAFGRLQVEHYGLTKCEEDLRRAIDIYEKALTLMAKSFMLSPPIYQLGGPQNVLMAVHTGAMLAFLKAATVWPSEAGKWILKAMAAVEATKSRLLTTLMTRRRIPAPSTLPNDLVERQRALVEKLALLESQAMARHSLPRSRETAVLENSPVHSETLVGPDHSITVRDPVDQPEYLSRWTTEHQALQEVLTEMERYDGAADYIALCRGDYLPPKEISRLANDLGETTALLSFAVEPEVTRLLGVCAGWTEPCLSEIPLDGNQWKNLLSRFVRELHSFDGSGRRGETWPGILRPLLAKMTPHMQKVKHVVFIPHRGAHLLPWGMLASDAGWEVSVSTVPALALLDRILRHAEASAHQPEVLVVGNPLGDLPHAGNEAMRVASFFNTLPLIGHLALKETVLERLGREDVQLAHFATHAHFDGTSPLDSGVVLADGVLTAREILERGLRAPRFVVLSACRSGMATPFAGEELAGLSQAFMAAGARSQLLSLWLVNDPATEHLMTGFYREWLGGQLDKATALTKSMAATRVALPAWAHTYYWGAFTLVGDWL